MWMVLQIVICWFIVSPKFNHCIKIVAGLNFLAQVAKIKNQRIFEQVRYQLNAFNFTLLYNKAALMSITESAQCITVEHSKPLFDLKAVYYYANDDKKLEITLRIKSGTGYQYLKVEYHEKNAPLELITKFTNLQIVFDCLRDEQGFEIDIKGKKIIVKAEFEMKGRKFERRYPLELIEHKSSQYELIMEQIIHIDQNIQELKSIKSVQQLKLAAQYELKFEEERKKYQLIVIEKQNQYQFALTREQNLKFELAELKNKAQKLQNTLEQFSLYQSQFEKMYQEIDKAESSFLKARELVEEIKFERKGYEGRKIKNLNPAKQNQHFFFQPNTVPKKIIPISSPRGAIKNKNSNYPCFVFPNCRDVSSFQLNQNVVTLIENKDGPKKLLLNKIIPSKRFQFQILILRLQANKMKIGIIDQQDIDKNIQKMNILAYCSLKNIVLGAQKAYKYQGESYKEGDTIKVIVELDRSYIEWKVNDVAQASLSGNPLMIQKGRKFIPFIELKDTGDSFLLTSSVD